MFSPCRSFLLATACCLLTVSSAFAADTAHRFIACGHGNQLITITNAEGRIEWSQPSNGQCNDLTYLPNGNVVWARSSGASEVTPDHQIVWNYDAPPGTEIHTAQPLDGDRVLLMQNGNPAKLLEIDRRTQAIVKELVIPTSVKSVHQQFRVIRKTPTGTYLVPYLGEQKVVEYGASGAVLHTFPADKPFLAVRLPDGHTLISGGDAHYISEVDTEGRETWRVDEMEIPGNQLLYVTSLQRLPNGNTVVANWPGHSKTLKGKQPQILELTPAKTVVWRYENWTEQGMFSTVQILDAVSVTAAPAR